MNNKQWVKLHIKQYHVNGSSLKCYSEDGVVTSASGSAGNSSSGVAAPASGMEDGRLGVTTFTGGGKVIVSESASDSLVSGLDAELASELDGWRTRFDDLVRCPGVCFPFPFGRSRASELVEDSDSEWRTGFDEPSLGQVSNCSLSSSLSSPELLLLLLVLLARSRRFSVNF